MSEIIEFIISYVIAYLLALAISLLVAWLMFRKTEKHISNKMSTFRESRAARLQSLKEVHAQVDKLAKPVDEMSESTDEIHESFDEIHESFDEISEDIDEIHDSLDRIGESFDKIDERLDRVIEFKRLMRDYSDYKIKMIEARENFREPEFSDEKNIH